VFLLYGDRVRAARVLRGRGSAELAELAGWSPSRQSRLEREYQASIESVRLTRIADTLRFPEAYFCRPPAPAVPPEALLFRAPKSITVGEKRWAAEFARMAGEVADWIDGQHRFPPIRLPSLAADTPLAETAAAVRAALRLERHQPVRRLLEAMELGGVLILSRPDAVGLGDDDQADAISAGHKHLGFSTFVGPLGDRPVTVLSPHRSWERTRWVAAHELGHLALHSRVYTVTPDHENEVSAFASEFLAPIAAVAEDLDSGPVTLAGLLPIKLKWGLSLGSLIKHIHRHELIDDARHASLTAQLYGRVDRRTGQTWGRLEPGHDAHKPERPMMLKIWMERSVGAAQGKRVEAVTGLWPADLVDHMTGIRPSSRTTIAVAQDEDTPVVASLDRFRQRRSDAR
jgi:Zn-dependent peptidase ImmA (M78 family)